jgi:hypothetical protein
MNPNFENGEPAGMNLLDKCWRYELDENGVVVLYDAAGNAYAWMALDTARAIGLQFETPT